MEVREALNEFAGLLSVGSAALAKMVKRAQPKEAGEIGQLLDDAEAIAIRLRDIATGMERLGN